MTVRAESKSVAGGEPANYSTLPRVLRGWPGMAGKREMQKYGRAKGKMDASSQPRGKFNTSPV
jgi:hypothetical protein